MRRDEYFEWLCNIVEGNKTTYKMLLSHLYNTSFLYSIPRDKNREDDGLELRNKFGRTRIEIDRLYCPCSILEMMVALAIRCEETIMDDIDYGDRTGQWFWNMITSLGLGGMSDFYYDKETVNYIIERFLDREYEPDGRGGLFYIRNCKHDLRDVEIWYQLCWYLDTIC